MWLLMLSFRLFYTVQQLDQTGRPESFSLYEELIGNFNRLTGFKNGNDNKCRRIKFQLTAIHFIPGLLMLKSFDESVDSCSRTPAISPQLTTHLT